MKNRLFFLLVIFVSNVVSAQQRASKTKSDRSAIPHLNTESTQQCVIKANVTGFKNGTKFYLYDTESESNIDSAIIQSNSFTLSSHLSNPPQNLWVMATVDQKLYYFTLLIGNENIEVAGDAANFPFDLSIKGSKIQDIHNEYTQLIKEDYKRRDQLMRQIIMLRQDSSNKAKVNELRKTVGEIDNHTDSVGKKFVKEHLNTYEGLNNLFYQKDDLPTDSLRKLYSQIDPRFKQTRFGKRIKTYLEVGKALKEGDTAADFEAFDSQNKKHRLSDIKEKYVLLDFSTTSCGPCIESVEDLKKVSAKYAANLSIVTFSGDSGKAAWLTGVNRDKPTWLSVWDGKGNYGNTIMKYGVTGYPTFVLINPKGKIVSMWVGYGKEDDGRGSVETKLDALMAQK